MDKFNVLKFYPSSKDKRGDSVKLRWISWWATNIIWFILFVLGTVIVWMREVDGAGVIQTPMLKLIAFLVLLIAFIIPIIIQVVWLILNLRAGRNK